MRAVLFISLLENYTKLKRINSINPGKNPVVKMSIYGRTDKQSMAYSDTVHC